MESLRVIVTFIVVLAIVGCAFAFNSKKNWSYCVSDSTTSSTCSNIVHDLKRTTAGDTNNKYYPCWDGVVAQCSGNNCTVAVTLVTD